MKTTYRYNNKIFNTLNEAIEEVMSCNPQLLDDEISDFCDTHIEEN